MRLLKLMVQYKIEEGMTLPIDKKEFDVGTTVNIPTVIFLSNGENSYWGKPYLEDVSVDAEFLDEVKGDKIVVFKKKRRKGFSKKQGHRQKYTLLKINKINVPQELFQ